MEGGSSEGGGKKESRGIFCFNKLFVFIKLPCLSCALHWLVFVYVHLPGHAYCGI